MKLNKNEGQGNVAVSSTHDFFPSQKPMKWKKKKSEIVLEDPLVLPCAWALDETQKLRGKETVRA